MGASAAPETAGNAVRPVASERTRGRGWRPWPESLRGRLIASHALTLVLGMSAGFLRRQEGLAQAEQLRDLAVPLTVEASFLLRRVGAGLPAGRRLVDEALANQAAVMGVRIFVLDEDGWVRFDTRGPGPTRSRSLGNGSKRTTRQWPSCSGRPRPSG